MLKKTTKIHLERGTTRFRMMPSGGKMPRVAKLEDFDFTPEPGMLYVATRAISSRVNANYDGWPPEELAKSFRSFVGRGVFVEHKNWDKDRSRGVILDAKLHKSFLANGEKDYWVELLIEVDAGTYPRLAKAILSGDLDAVSMGADVEYTVCSVCTNKAASVSDYCMHIPYMKGQRVFNSSIGKESLVWEDCYGVNFFEISFVFDPADESAKISDFMLADSSKVSSKKTRSVIRDREESFSHYTQRVAGLRRVASKLGDVVEMTLPEEVDTLRLEVPCPQCGQEFDGLVCDHCGFAEPPQELSDPDTSPDGMQVDDLRTRDQVEEDPRMAPQLTNNPQRIQGGRMSRFDQLRARKIASDLDETSINDVGGDVPAAVNDLPGTEENRTDPATADVEKLDTSEVVEGPGQSEVNVPGATTTPATDSAALAARRKATLEARDRKQAAAYRRMLAQKRKADNVLQTDVTNLDAPAVSTEQTIKPDENVDVEKPTDQKDQLEKADHGDKVNDGTETGFGMEKKVPDATPAFQEGWASAKKVDKSARLLSIVSMVDELEDAGLSTRQERLAKIARFERMSGEKLAGYREAISEFKSAQLRTAGRRVATVRNNGTTRLPQLGQLSTSHRQASASGDDVAADDSLTFIK